jgi:hypothetical protein
MGRATAPETPEAVSEIAGCTLVMAHLEHSVPAYGDKIESPDGSQRQVVGLPGLPLQTVWH